HTNAAYSAHDLILLITSVKNGGITILDKTGSPVANQQEKSWVHRLRPGQFLRRGSLSRQKAFSPGIGLWNTVDNITVKRPQYSG
ncbi:hypothetical protein, partial [Martelella alba]|uniref:hypothetical protein n=1 Tax=Martelella alba TaxID=2590451 RepID=UPI001E30427F